MFGQLVFLEQVLAYVESEGISPRACIYHRQRVATAKRIDSSISMVAVELKERPVPPGNISCAIPNVTGHHG